MMTVRLVDRIGMRRGRDAFDEGWRSDCQEASGTLRALQTSQGIGLRTIVEAGKEKLIGDNDKRPYTSRLE